MTSELGSKWYEKKMEGEMSVRRGPQPSPAQGKSSVSATLVSKATVFGVQYSICVYIG